MIELLFKFLIGHAVADYPLQGDFIGKFKSHKVPSPIPGTIVWPHLLTAHALIHAGTVWLICGNVVFAAVEFIVHWIIDFAKSQGWTGLHTDQLLHVICKVVYAIVISGMVA